MLTFKEFKKANETVDTIIKETNVENIENVLKEAPKEIPSESKREFYNHISSLFLNIILNRIDELGKVAKEKSVAARQIITKLIVTI